MKSRTPNTLDENNDGFAEERGKGRRACRKCKRYSRITPVSADTCRSLRTVLNSYVRYLCSQKPKEGETSLWIDALASYL